MRGILRQRVRGAGPASGTLRRLLACGALGAAALSACASTGAGGMAGDDRGGAMDAGDPAGGGEDDSGSDGGRGGTGGAGSSGADGADGSTAGDASQAGASDAGEEDAGGARGVDDGGDPGGPTPTLEVTDLDEGLPPALGRDAAWGGRCDEAPPTPATESWAHSVGSRLVTALGHPNHRVRDLVLAPGEGGRLRGRFTYGLNDKDLEDETVELFVRTCPGWESWGRFTTDHDGIVFADVPASLPAGDYRVRYVVLGDGTTADGMLAVWPRGVRVIVSDIDGTLTTSDWQLFSDLLSSADAEMYADAEHVLQTWSAKRYRVVYLTGRPQLFNRYSRSWLDRHAFPAGIVRLTDDALDVVPSDAGVRAFKAEVLRDLATRVGAAFVMAYGNATTDIGAYEDAGIAKGRTWIIGPHAGEDGTLANDGYTARLPAVRAAAEAAQP